MDDVTNIYEVFGLETPEISAEPVDAEPIEADDAPNPATAHTENPTGEEPAPESEPTDEPTEETTPTTPPQDNAANAAARRRAEREQEIQRVRNEERAESQRRTDEIIAAAFGDRVNPYTGQPIRTQRDYEEYKRYYEQNAQTTQMPQTQPNGERSAIDERAINDLIAKNPIVQKARQVIESVEAERQRERMERAVNAAKQDIQKIAAYDPAVTDFDSLFHSRRGDAIRERVNSGRYTLYEAWQIENLDTIVEAKTAAAVRAATNNQKSKDHLQPTQGKVATALEPVPADQKELFVAMGITSEKEQTKNYNKWLKTVSKG